MHMYGFRVKTMIAWSALFKILRSELYRHLGLMLMTTYYKLETVQPDITLYLGYCIGRRNGKLYGRYSSIGKS